MQLIPIENVNAIELFKDSKSLELLLNEIKKAATDFVPDVTTAEGRKEIASRAYKVSQSKTVIEKAGKGLTEDWARKKRVVDSGRKIAREFCDNLRDEIRLPLTEFEAEEKRLAEVAANEALMLADETAAHSENDLIDREAKVAAFEAKLEAERIESERVENERVETEAREAREEQIRKDAAKDAELRAEQEKKDRIEDAKRATRERIAAAKKANQDKKDAIAQEKQLAKDEADRVERDRLRLIEDERIETQARAANKENRRKVNRAIVTALVEGGVSKTAATKVVTLVAKGDVPAMSIRY